MEIAEKKWVRVTQAVPWSPQYAKARYIVEYWHAGIDQHNGIKVHARHLWKFRILANLPYGSDCSMSNRESLEKRLQNSIDEELSVNI